MSQVYLDRKALRRKLNIGLRKLHDIINDPENPIPRFRVGNKDLFRESEVDAWMERNRIVAVDDCEADRIAREVLEDLSHG
jgi:hypothetical protein